MFKIYITNKGKIGVILNPYFLECFKEYNYFKSIINIIQKISLSKIEVSYLHFFVRYRHYTAYAIEHDKKILDEKGHDKLNVNAYRRAKIYFKENFIN